MSSDNDTPIDPVDVDAGDDAVAASSDAPTSVPLTIPEALKQVLKNALIRDGLKRGLREVTKALDRREAELCILANSCEKDAIKDLVRALCKTHEIPLMMIPEATTLGEWAGLCKIDEDGEAVKVVKASCVAVTDWGKDSEARNMIAEYVKAGNQNVE
mmetsp:Transcript_11510/g.17256  ORF Transcript_11510/g.17256 Transcript_11510/m.17256 type:complete len:158 (+) Transcript_11510:61-534(+)|eukprot:CAMPEP_0201548262 /NCGR_PEP_ID=MMETSP0173_2-20130828/4785_1 /ASSEMBLY_ACC=CAM_ASM_000268 /TAXON_ID=218659 /ORGANISM="Vexillifera sp., Strain DIVA3 564/2" /LENGTH=157 /DNA_ID=CAMNT_0047957585 /DNA_START=61 /DNA_END=534 /DNA_ORIENTATION=-